MDICYRPLSNKLHLARSNLYKQSTGSIAFTNRVVEEKKKLHHTESFTSPPYYISSIPQNRKLAWGLVWSGLAYNCIATTPNTKPAATDTGAARAIPAPVEAGAVVSVPLAEAVEVPEAEAERVEEAVVDRVLAPEVVVVSLLVLLLVEEELVLELVVVMELDPVEDEEVEEVSVPVEVPVEEAEEEEEVEAEVVMEALAVVVELELEPPSTVNCSDWARIPLFVEEVERRLIW